MRWNPTIECSQRENRLLHLSGKSRKLFAFLRHHRHEIFDEGFQAELAKMYRGTGQGETARPPALLCMALLLQGYLQVSDAEAVRLAGSDRCWRMVLGTLDTDNDDEPPFSQGGLQQFRERLIRKDFDLRLLERTVELAKASKSFDWKKVPKSLRIAIDSRPLEGAGRVEDTINLLGHAGKKIAQCMAHCVGITVEDVCQQAGAPLLSGTSVKAALDTNWNDWDAKTDALNRLCAQLNALMTWVDSQTDDTTNKPLDRYVKALSDVVRQDVEQANQGGVQLRQGVAPDRRVSIEDGDMRHGRKSKSKRFNGYKQHISTDIESGLILACATTPANRPEEDATPGLQADMERINFHADELLIDRAYINSALVEAVESRGGAVTCKPWKGGSSKRGVFAKRDFAIDARQGTITCPAGQVESFAPGEVVEFDPEICGPCKIRSQCTLAASGRGRTVTMGDNEVLQEKLRRLQSTKTGREALRKRIAVEHRLAHLSNRQGPRARYRGERKNTFDLRRLSAVQNLEAIARRQANAQMAAAA